MPNANPIINGFVPQWASIDFSALGLTYLGIKSINYDTDTDGQDVMGTSQEAIARTAGNVKHAASMEMIKPDAAAFLAALQQSDPSKGYMQIPFDIPVSYSADGITVYTDVLVACLIKKVDDSHQQGSDALTTKFDLRPFRIKRGNGTGSDAIKAVVDEIVDTFV